MEDSIERWRGEVSATLEDHDRRLESLDRHLEQIITELIGIRVTLARLLIATPIVVVLMNLLVALVAWQLRH